MPSIANQIANQEIREVLLEFVEGENEGVELRVTPPRILIVGRSEECDIYLSEKKISRKHCELHVDSQKIVLRDLGSTNGTFINKQKVSDDVVLTEADRVQVGTTVLKLTLQRELSMNKSIGDAVLTAEHDEPLVRGEPSFKMSASHSSQESLSHQSPSGLIDALSVEPIERAETSIAPPPIQPVSSGSASQPNVISKATEKSTRPLSGNLSAMGLADLLQTFAQNSKNGVLTLRAGQEGQIVLRNGQVVKASVGKARGRKAFYRMLSWHDGDFEFQTRDAREEEDSIEPSIVAPMETLLMEGFRQMDEMRKFSERIPADTQRVRLKSPLAAPLAKLHPRVLEMVQLIINHAQLTKVLDESALSDLEATKIIYYLVKKDYVELS